MPVPDPHHPHTDDHQRPPDYRKATGTTPQLAQASICSPPTQQIRRERANVTGSSANGDHSSAPARCGYNPPIIAPKIDGKGGIRMAVETPDRRSGDPAAAAETGWQQLYRTEDWWAVWIGGALLAICTILVWQGMAAGEQRRRIAGAWLAKPGAWKSNPLDAFTVKGVQVLPGMCGVFVLSLVAFGLGLRVMGKRLAEFVAGSAWCSCSPRWRSCLPASR